MMTKTLAQERLYEKSGGNLALQTTPKSYTHFFGATTPGFHEPTMAIMM
jgi:hypothetical protein